MKVYPCGTKVIFKQDKLQCEIKEICIRYSTVIYSLTYYYNGEFKTLYAREEEFTTDLKKTQTIGFHNER